MKNNLFFVGSVVAMLLYSCVSITDEPLSGNGDICLTVKTPAQSRADLVVPEGYSMRCILQLIDANGNKVGDQKINSVTGGTTTFTITSEEQATATTALFWADYIKGDVSFYNTSDLKNITYSKTSFTTSETAAMDAFCNYLVLGGRTDVTLSRPFVNVKFNPENTSVVTGANKLNVEYNAPSSYNVLTSAVTAPKQTIILTNDDFNPQTTPWFSTFIFGAGGNPNFDEAITITVSGNSVNRTFTIPAGTIPMNANYIANVGTSLSRDAIDLTVTITPGYTDSQSGSGSTNEGNEGNNNSGGNTGGNETSSGKFEVGAFIDSNGNVTTNKDNAVAVVFHVGALSSEDITAYPEHSGTTIRGYAVALNNVSGEPQRIEQADIAPLINGSFVNSLKKTAELFRIVGATCPFASTYTNWVGANSVTTKTSGWYIPDDIQLKTWLNMLYGESISSALKNIFPDNNIMSGGKDAVYATCTGFPVNYLRTITVHNNSNVIEETSTAMIDGSPDDFLLLCRPMLTIFE